MEARADASGSGATIEKGRCAYIDKTRRGARYQIRGPPFGIDSIYVFKHLQLNSLFTGEM
jgi:hypothetical protein